MHTELLIIKCGDGYIRAKDGLYKLCSLDKASVFPMEKIDTVREHLGQIIAQGMTPARIKKLILTEEDLHETGTDRA